MALKYKPISTIYNQIKNQFATKNGKIVLAFTAAIHPFLFYKLLSVSLIFLRCEFSKSFFPFAIIFFLHNIFRRIYLLILNALMNNFC